MNPWIGKLVLLLAMVASVAIRAPHARRSRQAAVAENRKGPLEVFLLVQMAVGFLVLPMVFIASGLLSWADYPLHPAVFDAGVVTMTGALLLFHRSHVDLGTNWSVTLELREEHRLVTRGVYRLIRHPMYTALFLYGVAQVMLLANWVAGPACLITFAVLFTLRVGEEERMMRERFGEAYRAYAAGTRRLVPYVW